MRKSLILAMCMIAPYSLAGVYKCKDQSGMTKYQSTPCETETEAFEINVNTGSKVDLEEQQRQRELVLQQQQQQQQNEMLQQQRQQLLRQQVLAEIEKTQSVIRSNPAQYSAFAIPPYHPDKLSNFVKPFEQRLPEIEKMRRLAAQKALQLDACDRVEASQLHRKSRLKQLHFQVDCSDGESYFFEETEL